jgi:hypothetical protein
MPPDVLVVVNEPVPTGKGPDVGPVGVEVGLIGSIVEVGWLVGIDEGSIGSVAAAMELGAIRLDRKSKTGRNSRRVRIPTLQPSGLKREKKGTLASRIGDLRRVAREQGVRGAGLWRPEPRPSRSRVTASPRDVFMYGWPEELASSTLGEDPPSLQSLRTMREDRPKSIPLSGNPRSGDNQGMSIQGCDLAVGFLGPFGLDSLLSVRNRVELGWQECEAGRAIKRTAMMLLDGPGSVPGGQVGSAGPVGRDVPPQGRDPGIVSAEDAGESPPLAHPPLGSPDLASQFGTQLADDSVDQLLVAAGSFGMSQVGPGIDERIGGGLRCDEQFGVKGDLAALAVHLPEEHGSRRPDPWGGTTTIPAAVPQCIGPFDPVRKTIDHSLGR